MRRKLVGLVRLWRIGVVCSLTSVLVAGATQDRTERDLIRVRTDEAQRPWLSINASGHTAAVQALAFTPDSKRLCSAGLDKLVQVWNASAVARDLRRTRLLERTIRWQVARGPRGTIYALASSPGDGLLALGGYGAMGSTGEILLVDPVQGTLENVLQGHRQTVRSLSFSAGGQWLASLDLDGQAMLWRRDGLRGDEWQPLTLYQPDKQVYGAEWAERISKQPQFRPLVIAGDRHVVLPVLIKGPSRGPLRWKLLSIRLTDRKVVRTFDRLHAGMVTALAASSDGRRLASADLEGNLYLWELGDQVTARPLKPGATVVSLAFSPDGDTLVAGTAVSAAEGHSHLQVWDPQTGALRGTRSLSDHVSACAISPDGRQLAYVGGPHHEVFVSKLDDFPAATPLRGVGRRVVKVAFARDEPIYRVALGTENTGPPLAGFNDYGPLNQIFDPVRLELSAEGPLQVGDWLTADAFQGPWRAHRRPDGVLQLERGGVRQGYVYFDPRIEGKIICYCWLADEHGRPVAIAAGTDVQNSIYVCKLTEAGACPILRQYRGHHDVVTSVGVSRDMRYLVSGSADGTVRLWSLADYRQGRAAAGRWGAQFAVEQDRLVVGDIHPAGPLFFKGVRQGDLIDRILWHDGQRVATESRPAEMVRRLAELPWTAQVVFNYSRHGNEQPLFQLLPAWQPLANLFVAQGREWAWWSSEGYYDASPNGHTFFGWQVNRGLEALPDFFRADQFHRNLERPDVLEHLLPTGSLDAAFRQAALAPPARPDQVVADQVAATPRISILSPRAGDIVAGGSTTVRARIQLPPDGQLAQAKVFANGVVAGNQRQVGAQAGAEGEELEYEWEAELPADEQHLIQVVAGTKANTVGFSDVLVERADPEAAPPRPPRLYLLAVGVNEYQDAEVQPLAYSVADARAVAELLAVRAAAHYVIQDPILLLNEKVTRSTWQQSFSELARKLQGDVRPDDLLVIFMAGHGFVDPKSRQYYFAGYDISRSGFLEGRYGGSISWSDFALLADVPCRKLAFLDTCHSGAVQPLRERDLKRAIRAFQDDVVFTVTASAGHERSEEQAVWGHGAFTKSLLEALEGRADASADRVVTLNEVVDYVKQSVPELTAGRQNPTAAPLELLPFVNLRLTSVAPASSAAGQ